MQSIRTSQDNVPVVFRPNQGGSSSIVPTSMPDIPQVRNTGLLSINDIKLSAVEDPMNPSPSMDLTDMRKSEAKLIEDLKLLQRRRNALQESYAQKEIDEETYRLNVEANEVQMRNTYLVLQQIQDAIREFLGIPPQGPSVAANAMGDNSLGALQSTDSVAGDSKLLSDKNLQKDPLPILQVATGGEVLLPAEELALIRQELETLRTRDADIQNSLNRFRMPQVDDNFVSGTTNSDSTFVQSFVQRNPQSALGLMVDGNLPSPAPVPAVSGFSPAASSLLPPSVPGTNLPSFRSRTSPSSESGAREIMNDLINEFNGLNRREADILRMLGDSNSQQLIGNSVTPLQNNRRNVGMPQARQEGVRTATSRTDNFPDQNSAGVNTLPTLPENLRFNTVDDNNRIDRIEPVLPSSNTRLINNLLNEYNELNQRESEIRRLLDNQLDQNAIGRNDLFDRTQPQFRRDSDRSVDVGESAQNIGTVAVGGDLPQDFITFQMDNLPDQTLRAGPDGLEEPLDEIFRQFVTPRDETIRPDTRPFDATLDQTLGPDTRQFDTTLDNNLRPDARILSRISGPDARGFDRTFDQTSRPDIRRINRMFDQPLRPDASMLVDSLRPDRRSMGNMFDRFSRPDDRTLNNLRPLSTVISRPLSRPFARNGITSTDRTGLLSNVRAFDRSNMLSVETNFDSISSKNIQGTRPTPLTGSAVGGRIDESLASSSRSDSTNNNLVYNDGTITIEGVRPAGTYDEGAPATPQETGPVSELPVGGFSSRASGLLTPNIDSLTLMNRIDPRLGRGSVSTLRRRSLYPLIGNRLLQQGRVRRNRRTLF